MRPGRLRASEASRPPFPISAVATGFLRGACAPHLLGWGAPAAPAPPAPGEGGGGAPATLRRNCRRDPIRMRLRPRVERVESVLDVRPLGRPSLTGGLGMGSEALQVRPPDQGRHTHADRPSRAGLLRSMLRLMGERDSGHSPELDEVRRMLFPHLTPDEAGRTSTVRFEGQPMPSAGRGSKKWQSRAASSTPNGRRSKKSLASTISAPTFSSGSARLVRTIGNRPISS